MKKQIAVMMCAITFDNQRKLLDGMMSYARKNNINVFVFTNFVTYQENELVKRGAYQIMELPDFSKFDGVILVKNTIQQEEIANHLVEKIRKSGTRAVCINEKVDGMGCIRISEYLGQRLTVLHIIKEHQKRDIAYVTGLLTNQEGRERFQAYRDCLKEAGIDFRENRVFYGYYDVDSGRNAVKYFLQENGKLPEAIICANDSMAIGVIDQLKEFGYSVPGDVLVTGYDGDDIARFHTPSITTIARSQTDVGYEAMKLLCTLDGESLVKLEKEFVGKLIIGTSCSCLSSKRVYRKVREKYVEQSFIVQQASNSIQKMLSDFTAFDEEAELTEALKKYVRLTDMKSFYLCSCNMEEASDLAEKFSRFKDVNEVYLTEYTKKMKISLAYENGEFVEYDHIDRDDIIPKEAKEKPGNLFIVSPIHYLNHCYGYCVSVDSLFPTKSELFYAWVLSIGIGLENIRKIRILNATIHQLNNMWAYDTLTNVYNRAGFFYHAEMLLEKLQKEHKNAYIIFADIDGLKKVNDTRGHKFGDALITAIADCMRETLTKGQILMRYGGDEFVIFSGCNREEEAYRQVDEIRKNIEERNKSRKYSFQMEASMGVAVYNSTMITDLSLLIEDADKKMYREKKERKVKQGE